MKLSAFQINKATKNPDVLRALANDHDCSEVEADAIGGYEGSVKFHAKRAIELRAEADRIDAEV